MTAEYRAAVVRIGRDPLEVIDHAMAHIHKESLPYGGPDAAHWARADFDFLLTNAHCAVQKMKRRA